MEAITNQFPIKGTDKFKYSITYQETTPESVEAGDFSSQGFEVEPEIDEMADILRKAYFNYGINHPVSAGSWETSSPSYDRNYFEKGIERYYSLHLKHTDDTPLTQDEHNFITALMNRGKYSFDEQDNEWYENGGETYSVGGIIIGTLLGAFLGYRFGLIEGEGKGLDKIAKRMSIGGSVPNITDEEYAKAVNHWIFFSLNYPSNFWDAFNSDAHLKGKFGTYYDNYGSYGAMTKFWSELDGGNRKKLSSWVKNNYKGETAPNMSDEEYAQVINHWIYFTLNYPSNFWDAFNSDSHLKGKFGTYYDNYGSYGAMTKFWSELDGGNRKKLSSWVKENYSGTNTESTVSKRKPVENWTGVDADLETSLEEYQFVASHTTKDYPDEYLIIYKVSDDLYGHSYIRESELDSLINGDEWADEDEIRGFLDFVGQSKEDWLQLSFVTKLSDLIAGWGTENILGTDYSPNDKAWAYSKIGVEPTFSNGGGVGKPKMVRSHFEEEEFEEFKNGGAMTKKGGYSDKFEEVVNIGSQSMYIRNWGHVGTDKFPKIELLAVATITDLEDYMSEEELPKEGNFGLDITLVPIEKYLSKKHIKEANDDNVSLSNNTIANIVNYMGGLNYNPQEKYAFKTLEEAEEYLFSKEFNDKISAEGMMSGFILDKAYNRIGQSNWERLAYMMGEKDRFANGGGVGKPKMVRSHFEEEEFEEFKNGGAMKGKKDLSGNYFSTNAFVDDNGLRQFADKLWGADWEAEDDMEQIRELIKKLGGGYKVMYFGDDSEDESGETAQQRAKSRYWKSMNPKNRTNDGDIFVIHTKTKKYANGGGVGFKVGDVVYNANHNTIGIVRDVFDKGELRTDADGVVNVSDLEKYNKTNPKHKSAQIAPSTKKELGNKFADGGGVGKPKMVRSHFEEEEFGEFKNGGEVKEIENRLVYHHKKDNRQETIGFINKATKELNLTPFASKELQSKGEEWAKENGFLARRTYSGGGELEEWQSKAIESLQESEGDDSIVLLDDRVDYLAVESEDSGAEYMIFETQDDAERLAITRVSEDLEENPEYFTQSWLLEHIDKDQAELIFREIFEESYVSYATDIMMESSERYNNRLIEEMVDAGLMSDEDAESDEADSIASDRIQQFAELMTDDKISEGNGGFDYYKSNFGEKEAFDLLIRYNLIDVAEASEDAVNTDGIAHFLSSYDGREIDLSNGAVAYRTN